MAPSSNQIPKLCVNLGGAVLLALGVATLGSGAARAEGTAAAPAPAKTDTRSPAKDGDQRTVKENVKQLGREASDPGTLQRIKAHEQELEKKIESKRESQRKDHGTARPSDAVDLTKSLDKPAGKTVPAKAEAGAKTTTVKPKSEATAAAAPPPAASKPAPAQK